MVPWLVLKDQLNLHWSCFVTTKEMLESNADPETMPSDNVAGAIAFAARQQQPQSLCLIALDTVKFSNAVHSQIGRTILRFAGQRLCCMPQMITNAPRWKAEVLSQTWIWNSGWDLHRLEEGKRLVIGGVDVPHTKGTIAHSDGKVLCLSILSKNWVAHPWRAQI